MLKKFCILLICVFIPSYAWAVSDNIKEMCIDDYLTFCNQFDVGTPELTTCMKNAIDQLSEDCRNALKSEGYNKEQETIAPTLSDTEKSALIQEEPKAKTKEQKKRAITSTKPKLTSRNKLAKQSNGLKAYPQKAKSLVVTYPKWLEIPPSVGSSISVYGVN